jgi:hypothetical protein
LTFEFQHNEELDIAALADFFMRVGWEEREQATKVEWAIVSSDDWVVCMLEGELVGFGRTFSLDPRRKIMFDVVVDERFTDLGLAEEIMRRLAEAVPSAEYHVFGRTCDDAGDLCTWFEVDYDAPEASPETYTGP